MRIGTLLGPRLEDARRSFSELDPEADAFEIRLDTFPEPPEPQALRALTGKPLVATLRSRREGGEFAGTAATRAERLQAFLQAGFEYADVEGDEDIGAPEERLIRCRHELRGAAQAGGIVAWCQARAARGALAKFVSTTGSLHAHLQVLLAARQLGDARIRASVMGTGEFPRSLLPLLGIEAIYGGGERRPPGQPRLAEINATLRHWGSPRAAHRLFLVLGAPLEHSLSPRMHNAALQHAGIDAAYGALPMRTGADLQILLENAARLRLGGASVTSPLKDAAYEVCAERTKEADAAWAVNCLKPTEGGFLGHNTDGQGARIVLERLLRGQSGRILILGAGGAARAIAAASPGFQPTLAGRAPDALRRIERQLGVATLRLEEAAGRLDRFDAIVNATAVPDPVPLETTAAALFDLHYGPQPTPWALHARRTGAAFAGGRDLLIEQGVLAFEWWTGRAAPRDVMSAALEEAP